VLRPPSCVQNPPCRTQSTASRRDEADYPRRGGHHLDPGRLYCHCHDHHGDSGGATTTSPTPAPTASSTAATSGCFDRAKILLLYHQWKKAQSKFQLMHTTTRESVLKLPRATADDPSVAGHFKDAADAYEAAPATTKNAPIGSITPAELTKLFDAEAAGAKAVSDGVTALTNSSVPFC
jgi:hypothetical protein